MKDQDMAQQFDNEKRGALFRNDRRTTDRSPEYTGSITINGVEYWLSAWVKEGRNGKFLSLSCQEKEAQPATGRQGMAPAPGISKRREPEPRRDNEQDLRPDDDLPF